MHTAVLPWDELGGADELAADAADEPCCGCEVAWADDVARDEAPADEPAEAAPDVELPWNWLVATLEEPREDALPDEAVPRELAVAEELPARDVAPDVMAVPPEEEDVVEEEEPSPSVGAHATRHSNPTGNATMDLMTPNVTKRPARVPRAARTSGGAGPSAEDGGLEGVPPGLVAVMDGLGPGTAVATVLVGVAQFQRWYAG